jgi:uncharacterized oxidoreductase
MGRLGEFTERAAAEGFLSILTVGAAGPGVGGMLPFGGVERFFGANPWSFSVPGGPAGDVVVDVSSSTAAEGKVRLALARGDQLPVGIVTGSDGQPTTDPHAFSGGGLAPLGGDVAGHKGMGFALASALFGALAMIGDPDPTLIGASVQSAHEGSAGQLAGVFLIVIDPSAFGDPEEYVRLVSTTLTALRGVPPAPRVERVLVPGEPEAQARQQRSQHGLQLPEQIWSDLVGLAKRYEVAVPAVTSSEPSVKA